MRLLLLLAVVTYSVRASKCPAGSTYSADYNTCYLVSNLNLQWPSAEGVCNILGGHLASIHSKAQSDYLVSLTSQYAGIGSVWVSLANGNNNQWVNTDGSPVDYTYFAGNLCESGWLNQGTYCLKKTTDAANNWQDARNLCSDQYMGYMADDLSLEAHKTLLQCANGTKVWLGLFNNGSGYMWDRGLANEPLPLLNGTGYWVGGIAPDYNPSTECVYSMQTDNINQTWVLDYCDDSYPVICQKRPVSQYDQPTSGTYGTLSPYMATSGSKSGQWIVPAQDMAANFICEVPMCGPDNSAPASLLNPNATLMGLVYGNISDVWYVGYGAPRAVPFDAEAICKGLGANLPSVGSKDENDQLKNAISMIVFGGSVACTLGYKKTPMEPGLGVMEITPRSPTGEAIIVMADENTYVLIRERIRRIEAQVDEYENEGPFVHLRGELRRLEAAVTELESIRRPLAAAAPDPWTGLEQILPSVSELMILCDEANVPQEMTMVEHSLTDNVLRELDSALRCRSCMELKGQLTLCTKCFEVAGCADCMAEQTNDPADVVCTRCEQKPVMPRLSFLSTGAFSDIVSILANVDPEDMQKRIRSVEELKTEIKRVNECGFCLYTKPQVIVCGKCRHVVGCLECMKDVRRRHQKGMERCSSCIRCRYVGMEAHCSYCSRSTLSIRNYR